MTTPPTGATVENWNGDCPVIEVELSRGTDHSDTFRSETRRWAFVTDAPCPDCGRPLLSTARDLDRADGLSVCQRFLECGDASCGYWRML